MTGKNKAPCRLRRTEGLHEPAPWSPWFKKRIRRRHFAVLLVLLLPVFVLDAQTGQAGGSFEEKKPTIKDPRYQAPQLPEHLKNDQAAEDLILSPAGDLDLEKVQRALLKKQERKERAARRLREREFNERLETEAGRRTIEEDILEKFGIQSFPYAEQGGKHEYHETAGRRFEIVFFLSLPFTAALVGGSVALARQSRGESGALSIEESGGALLGGMVLSSLIGWYDNRRWVEFHRNRIDAGAAPDASRSDPPAERLARSLAAGLGSDPDGLSREPAARFGFRLRF